MRHLTQQLYYSSFSFEGQTLKTFYKASNNSHSLENIVYILSFNIYEVPELPRVCLILVS